MGKPNINDYEWSFRGTGYHKETGESYDKHLDEYIESLWLTERDINNDLKKEIELAESVQQFAPSLK